MTMHSVTRTATTLTVRFEGFPAILPLVPAPGEGSHNLHDSRSMVSDIESVSKPLDIISNDGHNFQQPIEGATQAPSASRSVIVQKSLVLPL